MYRYSKLSKQFYRRLHAGVSVLVVLMLLLGSSASVPFALHAGDSPEEDAAKAAQEAAEKAAEEAEEAAEAAREAEEAAREAAEEAAEDAEEAAEDLADELEDERDDDEKAEDEADKAEDLADAAEDAADIESEKIEDLSDEQEDIEDELEDFDTETNVETGDAASHGDVNNSANTSNISSSYPEGATPDIDNYSLTATNTNEANVENDAEVLADTGNNTATSTTGGSGIKTGDAFATLNLANVVNTNVINSEGFFVLLNEILGEGQNIDLSDFDSGLSTYEHSNSTPFCTLSSCLAEDVEYYVENSNQARVRNNAVVRAQTGANRAHGGGEGAYIATGDAYAGANVLNVVNTNVIDSNYLLVAVNGLGDLDGDLVLPDADFFNSFFAKPNALALAEDTDIDIDNDNEATIGNGATAQSKTGNNHGTTTSGGTEIKTGDAISNVNTANKVNQNLVGGDSFYMLVKVHGSWSGDVLGLPEGLSWSETSDGIAIYNTGNEIVPSATTARYDVDDYELTVRDHNRADIENNVEIYALTGDNEVTGDSGYINTGDAYSGGNVVNVANTNVVGRNWVLGMFNIFGDFDGDITFGEQGPPDLWVGGSALSEDAPLVSGSEVAYTFTVVNNGKGTARNVLLGITVDSHVHIPEEDLLWDFGTLKPGASKEVTVYATIGEDLPYGDSTVVTTASASSDSEDANDEDNTEEVAVDTYREAPEGEGGGSDDGSSGGSGGDFVTFGGSSSSSDDPDITITKTTNATTTIDSGTSVDYLITIVNNGGYAYDAVLEDVVQNEAGTVINRQEWELGTILPDEEINISYTIEFDEMTPTGIYTNTASLTAYEDEGDDTDSAGGSGSSPLPIESATASVDVFGNYLDITNVLLDGPHVVAGNGSAFITWETNLPADGQIFYGLADGSSSLNVGAFQYGYTLASTYIEATSTEHGILIDELLPGARYVYRIVSKTPEGLRDISEEFAFDIPTPAELTSSETQLSTAASQDGGAGDDLPQAAAAYSAFPAALNEFFESPVCVAALIFIVLLLFLFGILVEWALGRRVVFPLDTVKRSLIAILGATGVTTTIAYLVTVMPCLQVPTLILLVIFAGVMYIRIGSRSHIPGQF